eukprot:CAMPEP_0169065872 /NCGR_PEP_ID=MMETSP1015-20121227/2638_1 /TAXON_ID=342587 /ORGANISM="Karlodinium micrum, Strain CCMP2283" /LENGTH=111 /DNA_ID=CAMNT_0009124481 /DNA_START=32 /DNA_END=364 /DNA_ORIENTATION=+
MGCGGSHAAQAVEVQLPAKTVEHMNESFGSAYSSSVHIEREGDLSLGAAMKCIGDFLLICIVKDDGAVAKWNAKHPCRKIQPGDKLVGVNGITGDITKMTEEICKGGTSKW